MSHLNFASDVPTQPSGISSGIARAGLRGVVKFGGLSSATGFLDGPRQFVDGMANCVTTHNIQVADMALEGISPDQTQMHEQSLVFVVKIVDREDFSAKHVAMNQWQLNVFLAQMFIQALRVYREETRRTDTLDLSEIQIGRLVRKNPRLSILQFLSAKWVFSTVSFLGVQFGNRYVNAKTGPGIAVITSGSAEMRNTCLSGAVREQAELWYTLRSRTAGGPLACELDSYIRAGGPTVAQRSFVDLAGRHATGPSRKIGHVADKYRPDLATENLRKVASGLTGTTNENHWTEMQAPLMRIVLCTAGVKMFKV